MLNWIKKLLMKQSIMKLDELELPIALKIKEAQSKLGQIPAEEFSKQLVDEFQRFLCRKAGIDPSELGL